MRFSKLSMSEVDLSLSAQTKDRHNKGSEEEDSNSSCSVYEDLNNSSSNQSSKKVLKNSKNIVAENITNSSLNNNSNKIINSAKDNKSVSLQQLAENIKSRTELLDKKIEASMNSLNDTSDREEKQSKEVKEGKSRTRESLNKKDQIEIKRMKLISYLGNRINNTDPEEIEEAVSKMLFLTQDQFTNLLEDILFQIEVRTTEKLRPSTSNLHIPNDSKLNNLNKRQFKKLCLDVFYVFEAKYPSKNLNRYSSIISNLEKSIKEISAKMDLIDDKQEIFEKMQSTKIPAQRISIFLEYLRTIFIQKNIETDILDQFNELYISDEIKGGEEKCLNLLDPQYLLNITRNTGNSKIEGQRRIIELLMKKEESSKLRSKKLETKYTYLLRREVVNLILMISPKKVSMKRIVKNMCLLMDHLTFCLLRERCVFTVESFDILKSVAHSFQNNEVEREDLKVLIGEFLMFEESLKNEKIGKRVKSDELERLIVAFAKSVV